MAAATSENPTLDTAPPSPGATVTAEEVLGLIATERKRTDEQFALRDAAGAPGTDAIRRVFGAASSVPCNWHQATIFFAGSGDPADAAMKARTPRMAVHSGRVPHEARACDPLSADSRHHSMSWRAPRPVH